MIHTPVDGLRQDQRSLRPLLGITEVLPALARHLDPGRACCEAAARQAQERPEFAGSAAYMAIRDDVTSLAGNLWPSAAAPSTRCPVCDRD